MSKPKISSNKPNTSSDLFANTSTFQERVWSACSLIPRGHVATYGQLAAAIGAPGASRAVGNALNKNPYAPRVPCHRVVRADGSLGGFAFGVEKKRALLREEGVEVVKGRVALERFGVVTMRDVSSKAR